ncbi:hypothetical protein [Orenia marismortui]|uniref:hypothetical protein n=1 Tax=Orenia marismortui TaxID=46469 RepID=UPI00035CD914|nr:hypothetical protein [Orenia marismortui]
MSYDGDDKQIKTIEHTHDGSVKEVNFIYSTSTKVGMNQDCLPFGGDLARLNQIEVKNDC